MEGINNLSVNFRYAVRVGEWMTNTAIDCGEEFCGLPVQDIAISHVVVHPGYQKQTYKHNIALLVLRSKINYTGEVYILIIVCYDDIDCLPQYNQIMCLYLKR